MKKIIIFLFLSFFLCDIAHTQICFCGMKNNEYTKWVYNKTDSTETVTNGVNTIKLSYNYDNGVKNTIQCNQETPKMVTVAGITNRLVVEFENLKITVFLTEDGKYKNHLLIVLK